jgi:ankyrin repeat protein
MWACRQGWADAVRILLMAGSSKVVNANKLSSVSSPLTAAASSSATASPITATPRKCLNINDVDENGDTALLHACAFGRLATISNATVTTPLNAVVPQRGASSRSLDGSKDKENDVILKLLAESVAIQEVCSVE